MRKSIGVILLFLVNSAYAVPVNVAFEGVTADNSVVFNAVPYTENGMVLSTDIPTQTGIFGKDYPGGEIQGSGTNGSAIFGWCNGSYLCPPPPTSIILSLETVSGDAFALNSIEAARVFNWTVLDDMEITGNFSGGGTISQTLSLSNLWSTYNFDASWAGLESVTISGTCADQGDCSGLGIDNISVNTVPIPAAVWLFGSGLAGLGFLRRKKS
jgi:hypothetical protein